MKTMKCFILLFSIFFIQSVNGQGITPARADSLFRAQNWEASAEAYDKITKANPNPKNGLTFNRLGFSYYHLGKYNEAVSPYRRAIAISKNPTVMYNLACTFNKINQKDSCFQWLEKAALGGFNQYQYIIQDEDLKNLKGDKKFESIVNKIKINAMPCLAMTEYRQLDFWIGEWRVMDTKTGMLAGSSKIDLILDDCVILENWQPTAGFAAKSFSLFDAKEKKWKQTYVTADGQLMEFINGQVVNEALQFTLKSGKDFRRMTFSKAGTDQVRQVGELSQDGKMWSVEYDLTYNRVK
jgi:tetratricopeptide (TPR) repeat protein